MAHTDVQFDGESAPIWATKIKQLQLPRPAAGQKTKHIIDGWSKLRSIDCLGGAEGLNETPTELTLRNLPALEKVNLDVLQVFDLTLVDLPHELQINGDESERHRVARKSDYLPQAPLIHKLDARNLAENTTLTFDLSKIESANFEGCESAKLEIAISDIEYLSRATEANVRAMRNMVIKPSGVMIRNEPQSFTKHHLEKFVSSLAHSHGPANLLISDCDQSKVDWTVLQSNAGIKNLSLATSLDSSAIHKLASIKSLEQLTIPKTNLDSQQLNFLVSQLPNLRTLNFPLGRLKRLELENLPIRSVIDSARGSTRVINTVLLRNLPQYSDTVCIGDEATDVVIENVPELSGIYFCGPCPKSTSIRGLHRLRQFSGGGPNLTDEIVQAILDCSTLEMLTLAHCQLSEATLLKIADLPNLQVLCLTGTPLTAAVIDRIAQRNASNLRVLRLDDTGVAGKDLEPLIMSLSTEITTLFIDQPSGPVFERLKDFRKLTSIGLRNSTFDLQAASSLKIKVGWLEVNLDESTVTSDGLDHITNQTTGMRWLSLRNAQVPAKSLFTLISKFSYTLLDIEGLRTDSSLIDRLEQSHRTIDMHLDFSIDATIGTIGALARPQLYLPRQNRQRMSPMIGNDGQVIEVDEADEATVQMETREYQQPFVLGLFFLLREIAFWNRSNEPE